MKRYGRKSGKRWSAKARKAEDRAIRQGAPAAICKQCGTLRRMRDPVYDGPLAVTHGRCWTCGRFIVQPDFLAHFRAALHGRTTMSPPVERIESTDFDVLTFDDSPPPDS